MQLLVGIIAAVFGVMFIAGIPLHYWSELRKARANAGAQFLQYRVTNPDGTVLVAGATAQILDSSDSYTIHNGSVHDYVRTLFVVSPEGRHFILKLSAIGSHYVAPLTQDRAKLVLKGKYRSTADRSV